MMNCFMIVGRGYFLRSHFTHLWRGSRVHLYFFIPNMDFLLCVLDFTHNGICKGVSRPFVFFPPLCDSSLYSLSFSLVDLMVTVNDLFTVLSPRQLQERINRICFMSQTQRTAYNRRVYSKRRIFYVWKHPHNKSFFIMSSA